MIGKLMIGKTFKGCIEYCLSDKRIAGKRQNTSDRVGILHYNYCFGDKKSLIRDFNNVAALNPKQSKPVFHLSLSLGKGEYLNDIDWVTVSEQAAEHFGFEKNQYLLISHNDTQLHQHIHIVANRIGFEGKTTVSDSNSFKKVADFCRKLELKFNLQTVLNPKKFLSKGDRMLPRNDERKNVLADRIRRCLSVSLSLDDFKSRLKKENVIVITGRGITFIDEKKMQVKGSDLKFPLSKIIAVINKNIQVKQEKEKQNQKFEEYWKPSDEPGRSRGFRM